MKTNGYNMNRDNGNKKAAPGKSGNSLGLGILAGMVIGVALAAAVAWFLKKSPSPFVNREQPALEKPDTAKPATPAATEQPAVTADGKQRFQFYQILTDKQKATAVAPARPADQAKTADKNQPAKSMSAAYEPQILQAGSFPNANDAENLKAKLALLGVEASIQTATIKDKGVWYRVRLGPYKNADELDRARGFLKQNGVDSTPMRVQ
jgi:cell division protein FtsN